MTTFWDWLVVAFRGKRVAILGPRAAGKTTLYDYLEWGTVASEKREQTVAPRNRGIARRKDLGLSLKRGKDLPGSDANYPDWQALMEKSDIVFYVFDSHLARTDSTYAARISQDGKHLKQWGTKGKTVYLLGTHGDQDNLRKSLGAAEYRDEILNLDVVEALRSRLNKPSIGVGDLVADSSTKRLLKQVLK